MVDSYSNFFCTVEQKPLAYPQGLIYSLGLSITLSVISRTEVQMGVQGFVQPFPEHQNKLSSYSGHNLLGHYMQTSYPRHMLLY
jgi:hypothetical protein